MAKTLWNSEVMRSCDKFAGDLHSGLGNTLASLLPPLLDIAEDAVKDGHDVTWQRLCARTRNWSKLDRDAAFDAVRRLLLAPLAEPSEAKPQESIKT